MHHKRDRTEFLVGLFVFFGLVLLGTLILAFGGIGKLFRETYKLSVNFENVQALREGAPVVRGGLTIGYVEATPELLEFNKVQVPLSIYDEFKIPNGARFKIDTAGLMGDTYVAVLPPEAPGADPGTISPGATLDGSTGTGFDQLSDETVVVLRKIQLGLDNLNAALAKVDDDILTSENIENINTAVSSLNSTAIKIQERYINDVNAENINEALTSLKNTMQMLSEVVESLPSLIKETSETLQGIGPGVDKLTNEATVTARSFQDLATSLQALSDDLRNAEGAVPMLLNDPEVRDNLKALIYNLRVKGPLFYKDVAPRAGEENPESASETEEKRNLFQRLLKRPKEPK